MSNNFQNQNQQWQNQGQQNRTNQTSTGFSAFDSAPATNGGQQTGPSPFDWSVPSAPGAPAQGRSMGAPVASGGYSDPWNLAGVPAPSQVLRGSPTRTQAAPGQAQIQAPVSGI